MSLAEKNGDFKLKDLFKIRIAEKGDADKIYYLVQCAFSYYGGKGCSPASRETVEDIYQDIINNIILIIEAEKMLIGSLRLVKKDENYFFLKRFSIHPDFQDQGLGTILYYQAEEKVRELKGQYINLYSSIEEYKLISFYKKLGFKCLKKDYSNGYQRGLWEKKLFGVD